MSRPPGTPRRRLPWLALLLFASACQTPVSGVSISSSSSLLAVDVLFPAPMSRDPSLVQVFLVKGPIHAGQAELPELVPASFVKRSRAYFLDPEPGTYSVVAVTAAFGPPLNDRPVVGVPRTTWSGTSSDAIVFPAELIRRTRTTVAPGRVAFMGALRIARGDRIDAKAAFQDPLQKRLAERLRPGVTSESGLAGWLKRTRMVDLAETSVGDEAADHEAFFAHAQADLDASPWAEVVARAASREEVAAVPRAPAPRPRRAAPIPAAVPTQPRSAGPDPEPATRPPQGAAPEAATRAPEAAARVVPETATPAAETRVPEAATPAAETRVPETATPAAETRVPEAATAVAEPATDTSTPVSEETAWVPEPATPGTATREEVTAWAPEPAASPPPPERRRVAGIPPASPLAEIELGMSHDEVRELLGPPDDRIDHTTSKAWIPFYTGPGAYLRDWIYEGEGRVVFSLHHGSLEVQDVIYRPDGQE